METLLVFSVMLSLWGFGRWLVRGGVGNGLVFGLGIGLGVLAKGPPGLLPLPAAALALLVYRSRAGSLRQLGAGLAVALTVPLAWLVSAALSASDFRRYVRTLVPTIANELAQPANAAQVAAEGLLLGFFPWTLLLPGTLVLLARRRPISSPLVLVSLACVSVVLGVFAIAVTTRPVYLLPAYPALALLVAWSWQTATGRERRWLWVPLALGIAAMVVVGIVTAIRPVTLRVHDDPFYLSTQLGVTAAGAFLAAGLVALRLERQGLGAAALVALSMGPVVTFLSFDVGARTPFYNGLYPLRAAMADVERQIPAGAEVGFTDANRGTALAVNLRRPVRQLEPSAIAQPPKPAPPYVILPEVQFQEARQTWSLEYVDHVLIHRVRYILARVATP
jgi:4-amino-4-deoxy-L-arabinose transferase-like glycosyltransferase